jgi:hypothetical protein
MNSISFTKKALILAKLIIALSVIVFGLKTLVSRKPASSDSLGSNQEYTFRFNTNAFKSNTGVRNSDGQFDVKISALSKDDARNIAIKKCTEHYSNGKGAAVGEDRWLDIIDICVNPY